MDRGYFIGKGILLQRLEQRVLRRSRHGASEIRGNVCQTGKIAAIVRCGEEDQTLRRGPDAAVVRGVDPRFDECLLHEEAAHRTRDEDQPPVLLRVLLAPEIQTVEEGLGV